MHNRSRYQCYFIFLHYR